MNKRQKKKIIRTATSVAKKNPTLFIILALIFVAIAVAGYFYYNSRKKDAGSTFTLENAPAVTEGTLDVHILELGNDNPGDCSYINANGYDILIDAGSKASSKNTIVSYLKEYVKDGVIEFVILTHADADHIACFGISGGIFDEFKCGTVIDSPITNKADNSGYKSYREKLENEIATEGAKHYTALECCNEVNGAKKVYDFGNGVSMEILYNYFYEHETSSENNYSVCAQFHHGERRFLFTGDLEIEGEEKLVESNDLKQVLFYKAGHHGSSTSSNECLLSVVKPVLCAVNCVAGGQYGFPTKIFLSRIQVYTKLVFVTREVGDKLLNGNIVVKSNTDGVKVLCSNNDKVISETDWYKTNRSA